MATNTIEKVLAKYALTTQSPSLDVLIFDEISGGGIGIPVIKLLEEVDETARAAEQADMAKRNEIHEKYHELNDKDIETKARSEGYKEGQKDTAKQIFADLEQAAWQQIEATKLKQFYKEFSEAKDEQAALEIAKKYSVVGFSTEKFDAIKKQYGVE